MIGVHADLCRQIKGYGQTALAFVEEVAVTLVRFGGRAEARVWAHGPETPAIHRRINATRIRRFAGIAKSIFKIPVDEIFFGVEAIDGRAGQRGELGLSHFWGFESLVCVGHGELETRNTKMRATYGLRILLCM